MSVVNKNARYFKQAAVMLGEKEAERHLQIVFDSFDYSPHDTFADPETNLSDCFLWEATPQGYDFWSVIEHSACEQGLVYDY